MSHWCMCVHLTELNNSSTERCSSLAHCRQLIVVFVVLEYDTLWFNGKAVREAEPWIRGCWCVNCPGELRGGRIRGVAGGRKYWLHKLGGSIETRGNVVGDGLWRGQEGCQARPWRCINVKPQQQKRWVTSTQGVLCCCERQTWSQERFRHFHPDPHRLFFWSQSKYWRHAE